VGTARKRRLQALKQNGKGGTSWKKTRKISRTIQGGGEEGDPKGTHAETDEGLTSSRRGQSCLGGNNGIIKRDG